MLLTNKYQALLWLGLALQASLDLFEELLRGHIKEIRRHDEFHMGFDLKQPSIHLLKPPFWPGSNLVQT